MRLNLITINDPVCGACERNEKFLFVGEMEAYPFGVEEIGLKSVLPESTKWRRTSAQSVLESQEILPGGSTSTGMT